MTIGIYRLQFANGANYIGQSSSIKRRIQGHFQLFKKDAHYNTKMQAHYNTYGEPEVHLEEICKINELNSKELFYINLYDSYNNGLNLVPGGSIQHGDANPNSLYSNDQIIEAFLLLSNRDKEAQEISNITGVSLSVVRCLSAGSRHQWLYDIFPKEYNTVIKTKQKQNHNKYIFTVSNGVITESFKILAEFGRKYSLDPGNLSKLVNSKLASYKGWVLVSKEEINKL